VLDWEFAHVGDPLQDLAFTELRLFRGRSPLVCRLLPAEEYHALYTERTGIDVDPEILRFWKVVALVRAVAVYVRGCQAFEQRRTDDLRLARMGHRATFLLRELADLLGLA
jgi:aminoglycoside phosphotransferase (APT) family kinase protein